MSKKKTTREVSAKDPLPKIVSDGVTELMRKHEGKIEIFRNKAVDAKQKVAFEVELDWSEAQPTVAVKIGFERKDRVSDSLVAKIENIDQGKFVWM